MPEREKSFIFSIENFYKKHVNSEIIVVAQDYQLPAIDGIKIIKISSPIFNKGWCINVGVKAAKNEYVYICESEMYSSEPYLNNVSDFMFEKNLKWCFAWNTLCYTSEQQRNQIMQNMPCIREYNREPHIMKTEGGIVAFDKDFFLNIGGFNEWFELLGGIDNEIAYRAFMRSGTYQRYKHAIDHLWHPRSESKNVKPYFTKNVKLCSFTIRYVKEVNAFLAKQDFGNPMHPLCITKTFEEAWGNA